MTEEANKPAPRRRKFLQAAIGVLLIGIVVWAAWYLTSGRFNDFVRRRVVARLGEITGGQVELRSLKWNLSQLEIDVTDLTIHGLEKPNEAPPYLHADRLYLRMKIISLFQREIGIRHLLVERPVVHLIVYPDGSTNQPRPKVVSHGDGNAVQQIFELAVERTEIRGGTFIWNQQRVPLDLNVNDLSAAMSYAPYDKRYDGGIRFGKIDTRLQHWRPFASQVAIEFSLLPSRAQIKSLRLVSGRSHLDASGSLSDFNDPKLELTYVGNIDLAELANIARTSGLRTGMMEVRGSGNSTLRDFVTSGKVAIKDFAYHDDVVDMRNAYAGADFAMDADHLNFSRIVAHVFGGTAQGSASVRNWRYSSDPSKLRLPPGGQIQEGSADVRVLGIPLAEVAASFTTRKLPLSSLNPVGIVTGPVKGTWRGSIHDLRASGDLAIAPPENPAPEQMPVTGTVVGEFKLRPGTFDISRADLRSRAAQLTASGTLSPLSGDLKLDLKATSIRELLPIVDAIRGPEPLPVNVGGALSFNGTMTGKFQQPTIIGHLELRDFTTVVPKAAAKALAQAPASGLVQTSANPPPAPPTQLLHWEQLSADIQYSPTFASINHGVIRHGAAQINLDASATLTAGQFTNTSPFTARLNIRNADVLELQSIAGYNYPVSGTVNANLQIAGTRDDPHGAGHLSLRNLMVYGQPITSADADIAVLNQQTELRNVAIVADAGRITGTASYNMKSEAFRLNLVGSGVQLAQIRQLRIKRMNIEGLVDFTAEGSGTLDEPVVNAKMHMTKAFINGEQIGDMTADAVTHGADLKLTARSSYQKALLTADGNVRLRGDYPATIDLRFGDIYLDPLIKAYLPGRMTGKSTVAGTLQVRGPLKQPRSLNAELNLERLQANLENIAIHNDGPVRIVMSDQLVHIERFRLVGEETHFIEATGTAQLAGAQRLNFKVAGNINLKLLQTFSPDILSSGTSTFGIDVLGTLKHPTLQGRMEIANGSMSYIDLPNGLSGINGSLVFTQDRLQVERLTAKSGGGELVLGGFITYEKALTFNLTARGHDIRLRYPPGVSATADADITLAGTLKSSLLSGEITVTKFGINPRFDFGQYLAQSKAPPQLPKADSPLNGLRFDVHVVSTPELEVQTSLARVSGDVDLRLRGNAARPTVLGRVNIVEGDVFFNGTQYHLERGDVTFTNPVRIEPVLDLEASARVRDYDITLGFHGSIDKLGTSYRSDPPLPTGDIIALLALGRTREDSTANSMNTSNSPTANTGLTDSASNALLGQALNATVSSRVQKLFGVSRIKIDPQVGGPENNPNARLTIEQQVSNKVTLTYITNLSQSAQQVIQVEYNINKSVSIIAVRDQTGVVGFDVRVRQRKK